MRCGPYETLAELGRGGCGVVYRARHLETGRSVALKVLTAGADAPSAEERMRFRREIALARSLDHPGIVRVLDVGEPVPGSSSPPTPWFAMELIEGEPLYAVLEGEPLSWRRAAEIARDVADALAHAHARGVLHRDVKPGNILVGRKWGDEDLADGAPGSARSAFLTDFGLARVVATRSRLTKTGLALGTPEYMSPEQAMGATSDLTPAADVWGLGAVLYETLAGRLPFEGGSTDEVLERIVEREPVHLSTLRPDIPRDLEGVVRRCLAKRPRERYGDAAPLRDDLARVLRGERLPTRVPLPKAAWVLAGAGAVLASLAAAALLAASALPPPRGPLERAEPPDAGSRRLEVLSARARALRSSAPQEAARILAEALALDPARHDLRLERGLVLWACGENDAARREWEAIPDGSAEGPAARLHLALEALFRLDGTEAARRLEPLATGTGPLATLAAAARHVVRREFGAAGEKLRGVTGWEAALLRATVEHGRADAAAAVRAYDQALEEGIAWAWVHVNRGALRHQLGNVRGAIADFDEALRLRPDDHKALRNRADARRDLGDLPSALEDLQAALRLVPSDAPTWCLRGIVRRDLGDLAGAISDFDAALSLSPEDADPFYGRGVTRVRMGDSRGAAEDFGHAIRLRPGFGDAHYNRAIARSQLGDSEGALEDLGAVLRADPRDAAALCDRSFLRARRGDGDGALSDLDAALSIRPGWAQALVNRGDIEAARGQHQAALASFEEAARNEPDHAAAHAGIGLLRLRLGDLRGSRAALEACLERDPPEALAARARQGLAECERRIRSEEGRSR
ncbi:MAG: protein kinase [Planctomycetales bacterium]|nr:protein kinase [Planctomycetales bacterium]